jgi:hypothetical protein
VCSSEEVAVKRLLFVALLVLLVLGVSGVALALPSGEESVSFLDVQPGSPYYDAITYFATTGSLQGYEVAGGREFRPAEPVRRAQFAKMILGALGVPLHEGMISPFTDLGPNDPDDFYPNDYVGGAFQLGIVQGRSSTSFAPWERCKRTQVVAMVVRAVQTTYPAALQAVPAAYASTWGDYDPQQAGLSRVAEYNHLLDGLPLDGAAADPWGAMPRGEVAQVLYNATKLKALTVTGLVTDRQSSVPLAGVDVHLDGPYGFRCATGTTGADGRYRVEATIGDLSAALVWVDPQGPDLPPVDCFVVVETSNTAGYVDVFAPDQPVLTYRIMDDPYNLEWRSGIATVDLALTKGFSISGIVVDEAGKTVPGVTVWVEYSAGRFYGLKTTVSAADGSYQVTGLPPADYQVSVVIDEDEVFLLVPKVTVGPDATGLKLVLPERR